MKSKAVAALLAIFVGFLGIHSFYVGKLGKGATQLLLTVVTGGWGLIVTVPWALIDFVIIVTGDSKDSAGRNLV